jgi:hypothetical protein
VILELDRDGAGSREGWETYITFRNLNVDDLTSDNITQGFDPGGAPASEPVEMPALFADDHDNVGKLPVMEPLQDFWIA